MVGWYSMNYLIPIGEAFYLFNTLYPTELWDSEYYYCIHLTNTEARQLSKAVTTRSKTLLSKTLNSINVLNGA